MPEPTTSAALEPEFEAVLRTCLYGLLEPQDALHEDTDLAALGIDSLVVVALLVAVEDTFGVSIPDEVIGFEIFASPGVLWGIVSGLLEEQGRH
ncbi:phosphopantetheine-binding protein [Cellulomonas sp. URHD0024]|uniref:phosphopantetheine-binding protein n=1 Tax=Cellulomonas sp. URHD0024 TaxID=1302620 RepID=UPI00041CEEEF|nr:phosphopantetheine-binding protein [Cellulomonas sp. URHD0024]